MITLEVKNNIQFSEKCQVYLTFENEYVKLYDKKNPRKLVEQKHAKHKLQNNDLIIKLEKCGFKDYGNRVHYCANHLAFSIQEHIETKDLRRRLKDANFCKFRFCATCNWRRNLNLTRELLNAFTLLEQIKGEVKYLFLTLTMKNRPSSELKKAVGELNKAFKRMSKTKAFKSVVMGYFKAVEIIGSKTKSGEVHPHLHILLIVSKSYFKSRYYLSHSKWVEMWKKALRVDYTPVLDIRPIKAKRKLSALQSAVFEVAKYSVKHTKLVGLSDEDFTNVINQTKNMRFFSTGGILKEMINLAKIEEELVTLDGEKEELWREIYEEIYRWNDGDYRLKKINVIEDK